MRRRNIVILSAKYRNNAGHRLTTIHNTRNNIGTISMMTAHTKDYSMLNFGLSKSSAGITLIGDYLTLRDLHQVIHDVNEQATVIADKEGLFIALAYDIRKAYEGHREIIEPPKQRPEIGRRFGVRILWPVLICQTSLLRGALAFMPSNRIHQAYAYLLEDIVDGALKADFADNAGEITNAMARLTLLCNSNLKKLDARGAIFCSWTKKERKLRLASLLRSFDPLFGTLSFQAKEKQDLEEIETYAGTEWAEVKW